MTAVFPERAIWRPNGRERMSLDEIGSQVQWIEYGVNRDRVQCWTRLRAACMQQSTESIRDALGIPNDIGLFIAGRTQCVQRGFRAKYNGEHGELGKKVKGPVGFWGRMKNVFEVGDEHPGVLIYDNNSDHQKFISVSQLQSYFGESAKIRVAGHMLFVDGIDEWTALDVAEPSSEKSDTVSVVIEVDPDAAIRQTGTSQPIDIPDAIRRRMQSGNVIPASPMKNKLANMTIPRGLSGRGVREYKPQEQTRELLPEEAPEYRQRYILEQLSNIFRFNGFPLTFEELRHLLKKQSITIQLQRESDYQIEGGVSQSTIIFSARVSTSDTGDIELTETLNGQNTVIRIPADGIVDEDQVPSEIVKSITPTRIVSHQYNGLRLDARRLKVDGYSALGKVM